MNVLKIPGGDPSRPRHRRLKTIAVLPTMVTLGNLVCGFAAIHFAMRAMYAAGAGEPASAEATMHSALVERMLPSYLSIGALLIFLGMIFDMFDGLVARLTRQATAFGAQVDSLADVVTFGAAPAVLVIALTFPALQSSEVRVTPLADHPLGRGLWVCTAVYCLCAAIRLARFNVEHDRPDFSHKWFRGLPSPGAAAVMASLIMLHEHVGGAFAKWLMWSLPIIALGMGLLMISRIRYGRLTQSYLIHRRPFEHLLILVAAFVLMLAYPPQTIAATCVMYALSGPVSALFRKPAADSLDSTTVSSAPETHKKSG